MSLDATVRARVDSKLKKDVEIILQNIGLNTSQAINIFLNSVKNNNGIPFELKIPNAETIKAMQDAQKGIGLEEVTFEQLQEDMKKCIAN